jgi:hypothetical protein
VFYLWFQDFLLYAAAFFANMGNYKSFGGTKFIPNLSKVGFFVVLFFSPVITNRVIAKFLGDFLKS